MSLKAGREALPTAAGSQACLRQTPIYLLRLPTQFASAGQRQGHPAAPCPARTPAQAQRPAGPACACPARLCRYLHAQVWRPCRRPSLPSACNSGWRWGNCLGCRGPGSTKTCGLGSPGRRGGGFCTKFPRQHPPPCSRGRRVPGKTAAELGAAACEEQGWGCMRPAAAAAACVLTPSFCSLPQHGQQRRQQHRHVPRSETCTRLAHSLRTRALPPDPHLLGLTRTPPAWLSPGGCQTTPGSPPESPPHQRPPLGRAHAQSVSALARTPAAAQAPGPC